MAKSLETRIVELVKQFSLPQPDEDEFVKSTIPLFENNHLGSLNDEELFKILLSSFNIFFFSPITSIDVQFTEECNLRCDYCFVKKSGLTGLHLKWGRKRLIIW